MLFGVSKDITDATDFFPAGGRNWLTNRRDKTEIPP